MSAPASGWAVRVLEVADVRRWTRARLTLTGGVTVLCGPNGAGKTSLVEAISLACSGTSPRPGREADLVRRGAEALWVGVEIDGPGGVQRREIGFAASRGRRLRRDGVPVRTLRDWQLREATLAFVPDDLRAVKGPPAARRRFLDRFLEATAPGFAEDLADYQRALTQRNALLRRIRAGDAGTDGLAPWDMTLARAGARVAATRRAGVRDLSPRFGAWMRVLDGTHDGALRLEASPADLDGVAEPELEDALARVLAARRPRDVGAAQTLSGPHRDDVRISAAGLDLRALGSQGEQRSAVLAALLAQRDLMRARGGGPILLLDDVLSELDGARRERLLEALGDAGQSVLTSADAGAAETARRQGAEVRGVRDGAIV